MFLLSILMKSHSFLSKKGNNILVSYVLIYYTPILLNYMLKLMNHNISDVG